MTESFDFRIRAASRADIPILVEARRNMFADMGDDTGQPAYDQIDAALAEHLQSVFSEGTIGYVAEDETGRWIGAMSVAHDRVPPSRHNPGGRQAYLYGLWVRPECRRRGVARELVTAAVDEARATGEGAVTLYASEYGRPLYEKLGFSAAPAMRLDLKPGESMESWRRDD